MKANKISLKHPQGSPILLLQPFIPKYNVILSKANSGPSKYQLFLTQKTIIFIEDNLANNFIFLNFPDVGVTSM